MSVLLAILLAGAAAGAPPLPVDPAWSTASVWDDGMAEVAVYDATRRVYGIERSFETVLITVKEELDAATAVKADPPYTGRKLVTVLKANLISRIETENYPYHYMTTLFVRRDDPASLVKLAQSSQDWCGTTFKEVLGLQHPVRLRFHSYFDGQADGSHPMPLAGGAVLEDQLPLVLRSAAARMRSGEVYRFPMYGSLISNSVSEPSARIVRAELAGEEDLDTPAGRFPTWRIRVFEADGSVGDQEPVVTYWIERSDRRALIRMTARDGRTLLLRILERRDYWSR
ncbi:MAG TPA: hypothetical protein VFP98_02445 [Candidatus Polarisedimenticolia bacterium]|nr:hypothetical protein [Candidatus Polarisedimenticolia bacterium]